MQYTSYIPAHYGDGSLNGGAGGVIWTGSERYGDERSYDFQLQQMPMDRCRSYNKGMIWWIMQKHEATFRLQVQELHRLYGRQRELMEEMKTRQDFLCSRASELLYSSSSQAFSGMNPSVLQEMSWLLGLQPLSQFPEPTTGNVPRSSVNIQGHSFPASPSNGNLFNSPELPLCAQHDQKGEHEERNHFETSHLHKEKDADLCDSDEMRTGLAIDLNEPIHIEPPVSSSAKSVISEQSGVISSDDLNLVMDFDLNSVPSSSSSGTEMTPVVNGFSPVSCYKTQNLDSKNSHRLSGTILEIDLNSTVLGDEPSELVDPTKDADSMYPVSPENQEASPPRCESEDIAQDSPLSSIDLDVLAASTLVTILDKVNGENCLSWFAEIVCSSSGGSPKNDEHELAANRKRKPSGKHDGGHGASAKIDKRWIFQEKPSFSKGITNSTWKQQHHRSWGKTGKREGGCRRRRIA